MFHTDPNHRKGNQMIPTMKRAMTSSVIAANPRLMEPIYLVNIQCPKDVLGAVYKLLNKKRSQVIETLEINGTLLLNVKAYMPVNESTGFDGELRGVSSGKAYPQCSFDHWQLLPGDPFDVQSMAGKVCQDIRKMKNMGENLPKLSDFLDKL